MPLTLNATAATAMVARAACRPLAHVEAGLRSFDRTMPEEINRIVTDALADLYFTPSRDADTNLLREGVPAERIHFVGNIMIDTLIANLDAARALEQPRQPGLACRSYALVTLHRPANVDTDSALGRLLDVLGWLQAQMPVVLPVHPRMRARLEASALAARLGAMTNRRTLAPLGYHAFLGLEADAAVVLTDSGGVQEETTVLGVPCLTLRPNTERPVTVTEGTNRVVGTDPATVIAATASALAAPRRPSRVPELWDGRAAPRIADVLERTFGGR